MKNRDPGLVDGVQVVGEQVDLPGDDGTRWVTPRRDVDWSTVDFRWLMNHDNRQGRLGRLLKGIRQRLYLLQSWLLARGWRGQ